MIPIDNLIVGLTDRVNKNSNLEHQFIPDEVAISVLNRAQDKLVIKKIGLNNDYHLGLDSFKKRYEDLQVLIAPGNTPYEQINATVVVNDPFNSYVVNTTNLKNDMFIPINMYVLANRNGCKGRILNVIDLVRHGDIQLKLNSPHYTPNFDYQETIASMSGNNIFIYPDKINSFVITDLYITYLRYPIKMDVEGYVHIDGSLSILSNCELDAYLENELLDLAVEEYAMNTGNTELVQNTLKRIQEDE